MRMKPASICLSRSPLHPIFSHSALTLCGWLDNQLCSLVSGWVWPMGAVTEQRERKGNEIGAFIPWLPHQGRKAVSLHREGCILLKTAFLTRRSPPRFLYSRPLLIPLGPRGGNRSAVTSPGGTASSLLLSLHCTNTISMYLTLSDYPV